MKRALFVCCNALVWFGLAGCASKPERSEGFSTLPANSPSHTQVHLPGDAPQPQKSPASTPSTTVPSVPLSGAAPVAVSAEITPDLLQPSSASYTLGPGDSIEVEILGTAASRTVTTVGLDGKVYFSLLPGLDVWGLTLEETRIALEKQLGHYMSQPQVALSLRTVGSKYVWVLGRLNRPGIYPLTGSMTLLESLALAGGAARSTSQTTTEELADLRHSFVVRQGRFLPVDFFRLLRSGDASQNIVLHPDDFIYIRSALANEVYVLGAVRSPRAVAYQEPMTVISALAGAEGPAKLNLLIGSDLGPFMKDADLSHVAVVRGSLAQPQVAIVNCKDIMKGHSPDVRLEPGDILYVPNTPYTTVKRYVNLIINTFVTTVAANEGIRAAGLSGSVGVAIPVNTPAVATPAATVPR